MRNIKNYIQDRAPLGIIVVVVLALTVSALHVGQAIFSTVQSEQTTISMVVNGQ